MTQSGGAGRGGRGGGRGNFRKNLPKDKPDLVSWPRRRSTIINESLVAVYSRHQA